MVFIVIPHSFFKFNSIRNCANADIDFICLHCPDDETPVLCSNKSISFLRTHIGIQHPENLQDFDVLCEHQEKMNKAQERVGEFLQICLNPEGTFDWWKDADKPYCFLRAAMEIGDAMALEFASDDYDTDQHNEQEYFPKCILHQF